MIGEKGNRKNIDTIQNNSGGVLGIHQTLMSSVSEVWNQSMEQVKATPGFFHSLFSVSETRLIAKNIGVIATSDLLPIIVLNSAMVAFESCVRSQGFEPSTAIEIGLNLSKAATYYLTLKQTTQALSRLAALQAKQSSIFDDATKGSRKKIDAEICCHSCTKSRFIKGNIRAPLVYMSHQSVLYALRKLAGDMIQVKGLDLIVDGYSSLVIGQLIVDYRLSNDGLCDRHQHEYCKEFWERVITLGLPVIITRKIIAGFIESYTGVDQTIYGSMIENFISVAMVGLVHHLPLPQPVEQSSRYINPASLVRSSTGYVMDKVDSDFLAQIKKMFENEGPAMDYLKTYRDMKNKYNHFLVKFFLRVALPTMYHEPYYFVHDPVIRDYWPTVQRYCLDRIDEIESLQKVASYDKPAHYIQKDIREMLKPLEGVLKPLYRRTIKLLDKSIVNPAIAWNYDALPQDIEKLVSLLRSPELKALISEIKKDLNNLNVDVNRQGYLISCKDSLEQFNFFSAFRSKEPFNLQNTHINEHFVLGPNQSNDTHALREKKMRLEASQIINATTRGINNYNAFVSKNIAAKFNSLSSTAGTVSTLFVGGDHRGQGKKRAAYYLSLLSADREENYKLIVCIAILTNESGSDLLHKVSKAINEALPTASQFKDPDHTYSKLREAVLPKLYELAYDNLSLNKDKISNRDFNNSLTQLISVLIIESNSGRKTNLMPQISIDWYKKLNTLIKNMKGEDLIVPRYRSSVTI